MKTLPTLVILTSIGLLAGAAAAWFDSAAFIVAWMPVAFWILDLSLGALVVRWLFDTAGGPWGQMALPTMRLCASALPLGLFAALFFGWFARRYLPWLTAPEPTPSAFVTTASVAVRSVLYLCGWLFLAWVTGVWRGKAWVRNQRLGTLALLVHLPLATLFALDWLASLQPHWYSTALGPRYLTSQAVAGFAAITWVHCLQLQRRGEHTCGQALQDLGTLLFASIVFWIYVAFMQFLIIWMGDLPREVTWYLDRAAPGWIAVLCAALLCKLVIPGVLLCSRRVKRNVRALGAVAAIVIVGDLLDLIWQISPAFPTSAVMRSLLLLTGFVALGGCWALILMHRADRYPLSESVPSQVAS